MVSSVTLRVDDVLVLFVFFLPGKMATIAASFFPARVVPFSSDAVGATCPDLFLGIIAVVLIDWWGSCLICVRVDG
jgi:hypothetical protein